MTKLKVKDIKSVVHQVYRISLQTAEMGSIRWTRQSCEVRFEATEAKGVYIVEVWPRVVVVQGSAKDPSDPTAGIKVARAYEFVSGRELINPEFGQSYERVMEPNMAVARAVAKAHFDPSRAMSHLKKHPELRKRGG